MSPLFDWFNENSRSSRSSGGKKSKGVRGSKARALKMEALEERQLLSINPIGAEDNFAVVIGPQIAPVNNFNIVDLSAITQSTALAGELPQAAALPTTYDVTLDVDVAYSGDLSAALADLPNQTGSVAIVLGSSGTTSYTLTGARTLSYNNLTFVLDDAIANPLAATAVTIDSGALTISNTSDMINLADGVTWAVTGGLTVSANAYLNVATGATLTTTAASTINGTLDVDGSWTTPTGNFAVTLGASSIFNIGGTVTHGGTTTGNFNVAVGAQVNINDGTLTVNSSNTTTLNGAFTLTNSAKLEFIGNAAATFGVNSMLTVTDSELDMGTAGTLTISGTATFTDSISNSAGGALAVTVTTGNVTFDGGIYNFGYSSTALNGAITLLDGAKLTFAGSSTATFGANSTLTVTDSTIDMGTGGSLTFSGTAVFTDSIINSPGAITVNALAGNITFAGGEYNFGASTTTLHGVITLTDEAILNFNGSAYATFSATSVLTVTDSTINMGTTGLMTLSGTATFKDSAIISNGGLTVTTSTGNVSFDGGTYNFGATTALSGAITLVNGAKLIFAGATAVTVGASATLSVTDSTITMGTGIITVTAGGSITALGTAAINGALTYNVNSQNSFNAAVALLAFVNKDTPAFPRNFAITIATGTSIDHTGNISNNADTNVNLTVGANSDFTLTTGMVNLGILALASGSSLSLTDSTLSLQLTANTTWSGSITLDNSTLTYTTNTGLRTLAISGALSLDNRSTFSATGGTVTLNSDVTLDGSSKLLFAVNTGAMFSGTSTLTVTDSEIDMGDAGTLTISGTATFTDSTINSNGAMTVNDFTNHVTFNGGTYNFASGTTTFNGTVDITGATLNFNNAAGATFGTTSVLAVSGSTIDMGQTGTLTISGKATFTDDSSITSNGALSVTLLNGDVTFDGGTYEFGANSPAISGKLTLINNALLTFKGTAYAIFTNTSVITVTDSEIDMGDGGALTINGIATFTNSKVSSKNALTIGIGATVTFDGQKTGATDPTTSFSTIGTINGSLILKNGASVSFGTTGAVHTTSGSINIENGSSLSFGSTFTIPTGGTWATGNNIVGFNYITATTIIFTVNGQADFDNAVAQVALQTAYANATRVRLDIKDDIALDTSGSPGFTINRSNVTFNTTYGKTLTAVGTVTVNAIGVVLTGTSTTTRWVLNADQFVINANAGDATLTYVTINATDALINVGTANTALLVNAIDALNNGTFSNSYSINLAGGDYTGFNTIKTINKSGVSITATAPATISGSATLTIGATTLPTNVANVTIGNNISFNSGLTWYVKDSNEFGAALTVLANSSTTDPNAGRFIITTLLAASSGNSVSYTGDYTISRTNVTLTPNSTNTMTIVGNLTVTAEAMSNVTSNSFVLSAVGLTVNNATYAVPDMTGAVAAAQLTQVVTNITNLGVATGGTVNVTFNGVFATDTITSANTFNLSPTGAVSYTFNVAAGITAAPIVGLAVTTVGANATLTLNGVSLTGTTLSVSGSLIASGIDASTPSALTFTTAASSALNGSITLTNSALSVVISNTTTSTWNVNLTLDNSAFSYTGNAALILSATSNVSLKNSSSFTDNGTGAVTVNGSVSVIQLSTLNFQLSSAVTINGSVSVIGSTFTATGNVIVASGGSFTAAGSTLLGGRSANVIPSKLNFAALTVTTGAGGTFSITDSDVNMTGLFTVSANAVAALNAVNLKSTAGLTVNGTMTIADAGSLLNFGVGSTPGTTTGNVTVGSAGTLAIGTPASGNLYTIVTTGTLNAVTGSNVTGTQYVGAITVDVGTVAAFNAAIDAANARTDTDPYIIRLTGNILMNTAKTITALNVIIIGDGNGPGANGEWTLSSPATVGYLTFGSAIDNTKNFSAKINGLIVSAAITYNAWTQDQVSNALDILNQAPASSSSTFVLNIRTPGDYTYTGNLTINRNNVSILGTTPSKLAISGDFTINYGTSNTTVVLTGLSAITANKATFNVPTAATLNEAILRNELVTLPVGTSATINLTAAANSPYAATTAVWSINKPVNIVAINSGISVTKTTGTATSTAINAAVTFTNFAFSTTSTSGITIGATGSLTTDSNISVAAALVINGGSLTTNSNISGTTLAINGGSLTATAPASAVTPIALVFSSTIAVGNTTNSGGTMTLTNATLSGTSVTVNAGATLITDSNITGTTLLSVVGTLNATGAVGNSPITLTFTTTLSVAGTATLSNANLSGTTLTVNGSLTTTGGTITAGGLVTVGATGTLSIGDPAPATYGLLANMGLTVNASTTGAGLSGGQYVKTIGTVTWNVVNSTQFGDALATLINCTDNATLFTISSSTVTSSATPITYTGDYTVTKKNVTFTGTVTNPMIFTGKLTITENALMNGLTANTTAFKIGTANTVKVGSAEYTVSDVSNFVGTTAQLNTVIAVLNSMTADSGMQTVKFLGATYDLAVALTPLDATRRPTVTFNGLGTGTTITSTVATAFVTYDTIFNNITLGGMAVTTNVTNDSSFASALALLANSSTNNDATLFTITSALATAPVTYTGNYTVTKKNVTFTGTVTNPMIFTGKLTITENALMNGLTANTPAFQVGVAGTVKVGSADYTVSKFSDFTGTAPITQFNNIIANVINRMTIDSGMQTVNFLGATYDLGATAFTTLDATRRPTVTFVGATGTGTEITTTSATAFTTYDAIFTNMTLTMAVTANVTNSNSFQSAIALANNSPAGTRVFNIIMSQDNVNDPGNTLFMLNPTTFIRNYTTLTFTTPTTKILVGDGTGIMTVDATNFSIVGYGSSPTIEQIVGTVNVTELAEPTFTISNNQVVEPQTLNINVPADNGAALTAALTAANNAAPGSIVNIVLAGGTYGLTAIANLAGTQINITVADGKTASITSAFALNVNGAGTGTNVSFGAGINLTFTGATAVTVNANATLSVSATLQMGTGTITVNAGGTLIALSSSTQVNGAVTYNVNNQATFNSAVALLARMNQDGTTTRAFAITTAAGSGSYTYTGDINNTVTATVNLTVGVGSDLTLSTGTFKFGTVILNAAASSAGGALTISSATVTSGALTLNYNASQTSATSLTVDNASLTVNAASATLAGAITLTNNATLAFNNVAPTFGATSVVSVTDSKLTTGTATAIVTAGGTITALGTAQVNGAVTYNVTPTTFNSAVALLPFMNLDSTLRVFSIVTSGSIAYTGDINSGVSYSTVNLTVGIGSDLTLSNGTFKFNTITVTGGANFTGATVTAGGALTVSATTGSATFTNSTVTANAVTISGTANFVNSPLLSQTSLGAPAAVTVSAGGSLTTNSSISGLTLSVSGSMTTSADMTFTSTGAVGATGSLTITGGKSVFTGLVTVTAGGTITASGTAQVNGAVTYNVNSQTTFNSAVSLLAFMNQDGTTTRNFAIITANNSGSYTYTGDINNTVTATVNLTVGVGSDLTLSTGTFKFNTITVTGSATFTNATVTASGALTVSAATGSATFTNSTVTANAVTIGGTANFVNSPLFSQTSAVPPVAAAVTVSAGGSLTTDSNISGSTLTVGGSLTAMGTVLAPIALNFTGLMTVSAGTAPNGQFSATNSTVTANAVTIGGTANFVNSPLFSQTSAVPPVAAAVTVSAGGSLTTDSSINGLTLSVSGTMTTGADMTFTSTGAVGATGSLTITGGKSVFTGLVTVTAGGTITASGITTQVNGAVAYNVNSPTTFNSAVALLPFMNQDGATNRNFAIITANNSGLYTYTGDINNTVTATVNLTVGVGSDLTLSTGTSNFNTITLNALAANNGGALTINSGATVTASGNLTLSYIAGQTTGTSLTVNNASLTLTGAATATVGTAATLTVTNNSTFAMETGLLTVNGSANFTNSTVSSKGAITVNAYSTMTANGTAFNLSGLLTVAANASVGFTAVTLNSTAGLTVNGSMTIADGSSLLKFGLAPATPNGNITIASTGSLYVGTPKGTNPYTIETTGSLTVAVVSTLTNPQYILAASYTYTVTNTAELAAALTAIGAGTAQTGAGTATIVINGNVTFPTDFAVNRDNVSFKVASGFTVTLDKTLVINGKSVTFANNGVAGTTWTLTGGKIIVNATAFPTANLTNIAPNSLLSSLEFNIPAGTPAENTSNINKAFTILALRPAPSPTDTTTATFNIEGETAPNNISATARGTYIRLTALTISRDVTINSSNDQFVDISFEGGTTGTQNVTINVGATVDVSDKVFISTSFGSITVDGTLKLSGNARAWTTSGTVAVTGTVDMSGTSRLQSSNSPVNINGTANLTGEGWILTASNTITVNGTVNMEDTARMSATSNGHVTVGATGAINMSDDAYIYTTTFGNASKVTVNAGGTIEMKDRAYISMTGGELIVSGTINAKDKAVIYLDSPTTTIATLYVGKVTVNSTGTLSLINNAAIVSESRFSTVGTVTVNSAGRFVGAGAVIDKLNLNLIFNCTTEADVTRAFTISGISRTDLVNVKQLTINVNSNIVLANPVAINRPNVRFDNTANDATYTTGYAWGRLVFATGTDFNRDNLATYFANTVNTTTKPRLEVVGIPSLTVNAGDSAAITGAATLVQNNGGVVNVPVGIYDKGFSVIGNKPGIIIRGTLDPNSQANSTFIQAVGGSYTNITAANITIENIWFDLHNTSVVDYYHAVEFTATATNSLVLNCKFTNMTQSKAGYYCGPLSIRAGVVKDSIFSATYAWHHGIYYTGGQALEVLNNTFSSSPSSLFFHNEGNASSVIRVEGNTFNSAGWCANAGNTGKVTYLNNNFKANTYITYYNNNIELHGNEFHSSFYFYYGGTNDNFHPWINATGNYWGADNRTGAQVYSADRDVSYWALTNQRDANGNFINVSTEQAGRVLSKDSVYILATAASFDDGGTRRVGNILYTWSTSNATLNNIYTALQAGRDAVNAGGTIRLANQDINVLNTGPGPLTLSKAVTIIGMGANSTLLGSFVINTSNVTLQNFTLNSSTTRTGVITIIGSRSNITIDGLTVINSSNPASQVFIETNVRATLTNLKIINNTFKSPNAVTTQGIYLNYCNIPAGGILDISGNTFEGTFDGTTYSIRTGILIEGVLADSAGIIHIDGNNFINTRTGVALVDVNSTNPLSSGQIKNVTITNNIFGSETQRLFRAITVQHDTRVGFSLVDTDTILINNNQIFGDLYNHFTTLGFEYIINVQENYFGENATAYDIADTIIGAFDYSYWATSTNGSDDPADWTYCDTITEPVLDSWIAGTADGNYYVPTLVRRADYSNFADPDPLGSDKFYIYYEKINLVTGCDYTPLLPYEGYIPVGSPLISFLYPQTWESGDPRIGLSADGMTLIAKVPLTYNTTLPFTVTSEYSGTIPCTITLNKLNPVKPTIVDLGISYDPTKVYTAGAVISSTVTFWGYTADGTKVLADVYAAALATAGYSLTLNADGYSWTLKTTVARTVSGSYSVLIDLSWMGTPSPTQLTLVYAVRAANPDSVWFNGTKVVGGAVSINTTTVSRKLGIFTAQTKTGAPAPVSWTITGTDAAKFTIDTATGLLSLVPGTPAGNYSISVIANALTGPDKNITTAVTVHVIALPTPDPSNPLYLIDVNGNRIDAGKVYARGAVVGYLPGYDGIIGVGVCLDYEGRINPNFNVVYDAKLQKWAIVAAVSLTTSQLHDLQIIITTPDIDVLTVYAEVPVRAIDPTVLKYNKKPVAIGGTVVDLVVPGTTTIGVLEAFNTVGTVATTRWTIDSISMAKGFFIQGNTIYYNGATMEDEDVFNIIVTAKSYVSNTEVKFTLTVEVILPPDVGPVQSLAELNGAVISSTKTYAKGAFVGYLDFEGITYGEENGLYIDDVTNFQCVYDPTTNKYKILANKALSVSAAYDFNVFDKNHQLVQVVRVYVKAVNVDAVTVTHEAKSVRVNGLVATPTFNADIISGASVTMIPLASNGTTATVGEWAIYDSADLTTPVETGYGSTIEFKPSVAGIYTVKVYDASSIDPATGKVDESKVVRFNIVVTIKSVVLNQIAATPTITKGSTIAILSAGLTDPVLGPVAKKTIPSSQLPTVGGTTITLSNTLVNVVNNGDGTVSLTAASAMTITKPIYIGLTIDGIVVILEISLNAGSVMVNFL